MVGFSTGLLIGLIAATRIHKEKYMNDYKEAEDLYNKSQSVLELYRDAYEKLLDSYNIVFKELEFHKRNNIGTDKAIKEAVKLAMIKSHPDVGGNSEKFIKFRELYNKLK